jgi:hypothetical protein
MTLLSRILRFWSVFAVAGFAVYVARRYQRKEGAGDSQRDSFSSSSSSSPSSSSVIRELKDHGSSELHESTRDEQQRWPPPDPRIEALVSQLCQEIACHDSLRVVNRTFRATEYIPVGETLFEIPRKMQIWDLDAYRDPFVRKHLFKASHKVSGNRLGSEAFLAAFLALEIKRTEQYPSSFDPFRLTYFQSLPSYEEYLAHHPILQDTLLMREILGRSVAHSVVQAYRNMVNSEFEAFASVSSEFQGLISKEEYLRARLNVMTRVIKVGIPGPEEVMPGTFIGNEFENEDLLQDELVSYQDLIGVNLTAGSLALIPLADLFNHHPSSNVQFKYQRRQPNKTGRSFVVTSAHRAIEANTEPMASYGSMSDSHLYSRYGFVNGDGSGPTQISLAFHHDILKLNISSQYDYLPDTGTTPKFRSHQRRGLAKYLSYDDGYSECIAGPVTHPEGAELKLLKLEHLMRIANDYGRWNVLMPPRSPFSMPGRSTDLPITMVTPQFYTNYTHLPDDLDNLQETCRFMSLINADFNGNAVQVLRDNLGNPDFFIGPDVSDSLEFRSFLCLSRWFGTTVVTMELQGSLASEGQRISRLNHNEFGSRNWTAYHVRFGEMQALKAAATLIFARVSESWEDKKVDPETEYTMKDESCPDDNMKFLFREEELNPFSLDL